MARLLLFQADSGDDEYVVISDDMDDADDRALEDEHGARGCRLKDKIDLFDSVSLWPTERPLKPTT